MHDYFKLQRLSDDLIYQFDKTIQPNNIIGYKRRDKDLWITYRENIGWCAYDEKTNEIQGLPRGIKIDDQSKEHPPEGTWVSKKRVKSYVYELKFISL